MSSTGSSLKLRRTILRLILFALAALPSVSVVLAGSAQSIHRNRFADTSECAETKPIGHILYLAETKNPPSDSQELVVAEPSGKILRRIVVPRKSQIFPADKFGRAFVLAPGEQLFLLDANSGELKNIEIPRPFWEASLGRDYGIPRDHSWQVLEGFDFSYHRFVNLNTGESRPITWWIGLQALDFPGFIQVAPDGEHVAISAGGDLIVGSPNDTSSFRAIDSRVDYFVVSPSGDSIIYIRSLGGGTFQLKSAPFEEGNSRALYGGPGFFDFRLIPEMNWLMISNDFSSNETFIAIIDLDSGQRIASVNLTENIGWHSVGLDGARALVFQWQGQTQVWKLLDLKTGELVNADAIDGYRVDFDFIDRRWLLASPPDNLGRSWESGRPLFSVDLQTGLVQKVADRDSAWTSFGQELISDDGRFHLVLAQRADGIEEIVVLDVSGGPHRVLSEGEQDGFVLSPDDCWIAYSTHQESADTGGNGLYIVPTAGGTPRKIGEGLQPVWIMY